MFKKVEDKLKALVDLSKSAVDLQTLDAVIGVLEKAKKFPKLSDEHDPHEDVGDDEADELDQHGYRAFDPDQEEAEGDDWLNANDPERKKPDEEEEDDEDPEKVDEDAAPSQEVPATASKPKVQEPVSEVPSGGEEPPAAKEDIAEGRFSQPSKEDLIGMREYTRPWEQRARDSIRLRAEARKNPVLHREGHIVEARNASHRDRQEAYDKYTNSDEYKNADPISQMEMDAKFHDDYHKENPDYLKDALKSHGDAHREGMKAQDIHAAAKDEQIRHVIRGGAQADEPTSVEAAMQHAGGEKGEDGTTGSMIQDKASSFAAGNKEFLDHYAKEYEKKNKTPKTLEDMGQYDEGSKKDIERILGQHPNLKDPAKKQKVDQFFKQYHPLISMSTSRVMNKLGLDPQKHDVDLGMLHEAGMHGLFQAINDYEHENPGKASFATHAGNKIRGLMQTALRNQDQIPADIRTKAKRFQQQKNSPVTQTVAAPKVPSATLVQQHPQAADMMDRHKRVTTQRAAQGVTPPKKPEGETE